MDLPRHRPEPAPPSATPLRALRYAAVSFWILALAAGATTAIVWVTDWLLTR
jgi:hypothetical protein